MAMYNTLQFFWAGGGEGGEGWGEGGRKKVHYGLGGKRDFHIYEVFLRPVILFLSKAK